MSALVWLALYALAGAGTVWALRSGGAYRYERTTEMVLCAAALTFILWPLVAICAVFVFFGIVGDCLADWLRAPAHDDPRRS